jgi:hypothetical protein
MLYSPALRISSYINEFLRFFTSSDASHWKEDRNKQNHDRQQYDGQRGANIEIVHHLVAPSSHNEQIQGPYRKWRHEHIFKETRKGTLMTDRVSYAVPGGKLIDRFFVRSDVQRIFEFRKNALTSLLRMIH